MNENDNVWSQNPYAILQQEIKQLQTVIEPFYLVFMFETNQHPNNYTALFDQYRAQDTIIYLDNEEVFHTSQIFVLSETSYKENEALFLQLRLRARNRIVEKIAQSIIFYVVEQRGAQAIALLSKQTLLDKSLHVTKKLILEKTLVGESDTWEAFNNWYRQLILEFVLEEIIVNYGIQHVKTLPTEQLNTLFFQFLSENVSNMPKFVEKIAHYVERYFNQWVEKAIVAIEDDIQPYIQDEKIDLQPLGIKDFGHLTTVPHHMYVMNNIVYQIIRESIYQKNFVSEKWPTRTFTKGKTAGRIEIIPLSHDEKEAETIFQQLSIHDVDTLDSLCALFLHRTKNPHDFIEIHLTDLLMMRDLKPKLSGVGRRGGYDRKQKEQVFGALHTLQSMTVSLDGKVKGERILAFETKDGEACQFKKMRYDEPIYCRIGQLFVPFLTGSHRQLALLHLHALKYHSYRQRFEKQLTRYLSWRWRTQASQGTYFQPNKVQTLLDALGEQLYERTPSRTKERFEKALDQLQSDGIIADWHYTNWDESLATGKHWGRYWLSTSVVIEPPRVILETYQSILKKTTPMSAKEKEQFAVQLATARKNRNLTLLQAGEQLNISAAYVSKLERQQATPSSKLKKTLLAWIEQS